MPERRRRFSPQFKAEAVQMVLETGRSTAAVARYLGIHDGTLGNWVNAWRREYPEPDQPLTPQPTNRACKNIGSGTEEVVMGQLSRIRRRSRAKSARPYICRLSSLTLVLTPSVGPLL